MLAWWPLDSPARAHHDWGGERRRERECMGSYVVTAAAGSGGQLRPNFQPDVRTTTTWLIDHDHDLFDRCTSLLVVVKYYTTRILAYMLGARLLGCSCQVMCVHVHATTGRDRERPARERRDADRSRRGRGCMHGWRNRSLFFSCNLLIALHHASSLNLMHGYTRRDTLSAAGRLCPVRASSQRGVEIKGATLGQMPPFSLVFVSVDHSTVLLVSPLFGTVARETDLMA
jgi:hypothetical protein